jgi:hypothetical protein
VRWPIARANSRDDVDNAGYERCDTYEHRAVDHVGHCPTLLVDPIADVPYMFFVGQHYLQPLHADVSGPGTQRPDDFAGRLFLVREPIKLMQ